MLFTSQGLPADFARIELVTMPRYFGIAFNPLNLYYCYAADGGATPQLIVLEVNNTFGETFVYCMHPDRQLDTTQHGSVAVAAGLWRPHAQH